MQITSINNNYNIKNTSFKAGKIKVLNPNTWTDAELKAFANNDAFKILANNLKKKKLDLYIGIKENGEKHSQRFVELFTGKNDNKLDLYQTISGAIWQEKPETRTLVDNIVTYPTKLETLFEEEAPELKNRIKEDALKEIVKFNKKGNAKIYINNPDSWKASELKALIANENFKILAQKIINEKQFLIMYKNYNKVSDEQYIELFGSTSGNPEKYIGTIRSNRAFFENKPTSIADAIAIFKEPNKQYTIGESRQDALNSIRIFNDSQQTEEKSVLDFFKKIFSRKK